MENKVELYQKSIKDIKGRFEEYNTKGIIPRMATVAAVLKENFPHYIWCGFYFAEEDEMVVGPYQGLTACPNISYEGVCGESAKKKEPVIVPDVHKFPGHIVCDMRSNSEIVVPLLDKDNRLIGVLDIDSAELDAFDEMDRKYLEEIMPILLEK